MEMQHRAYILLAVCVRQMLLVVGVAEEGKSYAVAAEARLDNVGYIVLVRLLIVVGEVLAARLLMTAKVVIRAVGYAPQLAPVGERECILDVGGRL